MIEKEQFNQLVEQLPDDVRLVVKALVDRLRFTSEQLSRIGLAIKVSQAAGKEHSTLIFDEVDAGVGGAIAELVGDRLRGLAADRQVFCVTHLPQVASRGHRHFRVTKSASGTPAVLPLSDAERVQEIARMLGGKTITERTRAHAEEMLEAD